MPILIVSRSKIITLIVKKKNLSNGLEVNTEKTWIGPCVHVT